MAQQCQHDLYDVQTSSAPGASHPHETSALNCLKQLHPDVPAAHDSVSQFTLVSPGLQSDGSLASDVAPQAALSAH